LNAALEVFATKFYHQHGKNPSTKKKLNVQIFEITSNLLFKFSFQYKIFKKIMHFAKKQQLKNETFKNLQKQIF